ncbi:MAG: SIS domain-containing protein, partial [Clostridiales bacterium]|nr:SIS domain-containing protein [Clostridiales bacterium]
KNDLLFAVSYSGKKQETLELAKIALQRDVPVISFTRVGNTPLAECSVVNFEAAAFEDVYRTGAFGSRIAQLYLVDVIFLTYSLFFSEQASSKLRNTYEIVNPNRM